MQLNLNFVFDQRQPPEPAELDTLNRLQLWATPELWPKQGDLISLPSGRRYRVASRAWHPLAQPAELRFGLEYEGQAEPSERHIPPQPTIRLVWQRPPQ